MGLAISLLVTACGGPQGPAASDCPGSVSRADASSAVGTVATVRGPVAGTSYRPDVGGAPTFINLGKDYPDQSRFTAIVWGDARSNFSEAPESMYSDGGLCIRGTVVDYQGVPEIQVQDPDQVVRVEH
jgi:hypothetical protein